MKKLKKNNLKVIAFFAVLFAVFFIGFPTKALALDLDLLPFNIKPAYEVLRDDKSIKQFWQLVLDFTNGFVIIVLIAVAFTQILRININTYGVKKILPSLVLAVIAANFSYLFCRLMIDFANIIMDGIINSNGVTKDAMSNALNGGSSGGWAAPDAAHGLFYNMKDNLGIIFLFGIMQILLVASGVILYILSFLFFIRLWMIYFLVPLAPLAIMAMVLPQTKSLFSQWWSNFSKWVFMPVVSIFWIWVGSKWLGLAEGHWFMQIIFAGACFYLAITSPFKMGGAVMSAWGKLGKQAGRMGTGFQGNLSAGLSLMGQNMMKTNPENSFRHNWGRRFNKVGGATNVKAIQQAIKGRREGFNQSLRKAEVKTGTYNRFGGVPVRFEAAKAKLEDELKYMPSKVTGREMDKIETEMLAKYGVGKQGRLLEAEASKIMSDNGWVDDEDHRRAALRQVIATNGPNNLFLKYKGFTEHFKDEDQIVRTEGIARNFLKDAKSQRARVDLEATDGYGRLIPVASSAVGTPGQAGAAGQGGAGGQGGTGGQGTTARPPVRSLPEQIKDIAAIAGEDKADLIVEKIVGSIDVGDIDISLLTKDLQPREANEIKAQANQFGKMIEEERETTGGKEKVDDLSNGLFRIKEIMEDLKTGDISQIERAIRSSMGPPIDLSLPGDEKDASVTASTGERKISIHALDALQKLTEKNPERTSLDPASFDAQSHSLINDEVENQRSAVVRGTTASQKTLSEVAAASGNLPLENLDLERVLEKLNQNLEELNDSVGGVAHSAANPLSELRGAGIGAIADRKALEDLLKSAQSGLRDDLRGAKQSVFDKGYTGKDSLANPAVMRAFSDELTTRLVKRLSNAPLKAQVTNLPRSPLAGQRTSAAPTPAPVQPQAQTAPTQNQSRPVRTTRTPVYTAPPPARETARPQVQTAPPPTIRTRPPRPKL